MATLKFTKNASRIVLKSVMETKPPTEELNSLKDEVRFLKDILHIKRFGGGISELIYKVKELQNENEKLKKLSITPKPLLQDLINQNLVLQQELIRYRNQSPSEDHERAGFETSENQSLLKEPASKSDPHHQTYIIKSFIGENRTTDPQKELPAGRIGDSGSKQLGSEDYRAVQEDPSETRKDFRIATLEPNSPRKSHPGLLSPREDSEGLNARVTSKQFRGSALEPNETPKLKFALKNIKLTSPFFSVKSGLQTQIGHGNFSTAEKSQKAQKYPQLNVSASKKYLKSQFYEPSSKLTSSVFSTGKPVSVKRNESQDALVLVEDLMQKRMAKQNAGGGQLSLKHSKFSESPRAEDYLSKHLDRQQELGLESRYNSSSSPKHQTHLRPTPEPDLQLQKSVRTADLLRRLQEISALGFEPTQTLSPKMNNFVGQTGNGHLFPLANHRSPSSSPTKPQIRSSQPTGVFLGKVEFNMREMKRELEKLKFT